MRVKELIDKLQEFNPEAEVFLVAHDADQEFSICWGGNDGEGITRQHTSSVSFYVDELCQSERAG